MYMNKAINNYNIDISCYDIYSTLEEKQFSKQGIKAYVC